MSKTRSNRFWIAIGIAALATQAAAAESGSSVIQKMIAAHGGMEAWQQAPTISFDDEFRQGASEQGFPARVAVEQGKRRAYIEYIGTPMRMAWDGEKAWSENWQSPLPPRFLALLNYYFANLPWLTQDPGVILGDPGAGKILDDPTEYITVRMTFESGVGDTPDDYYVLFIDPETHRLHANEYVVTYGSILPEGVEHSPPHILVYDEWTEVEGLVLPTHYTIYEEGEVYGSCVFRNWSLTEAFDETRMVMAEGAVVDETTP